MTAGGSDVTLPDLRMRQSVPVGEFAAGCRPAEALQSLTWPQGSGKHWNMSAAN